MTVSPPVAYYVRRLRRSVVGCLFAGANLLCAHLGIASPSVPTDVSESEVKAALVFRAAKFIDWPSRSFADARTPFVICVVGNADAFRAFEPLGGRTVNNHPVAVRRVTGDALDLKQCHTAFFSQDATSDTDYALSKLQSLPVLTVGESADFAQRGGILSLLTRDQRVRFTINLSASKQAGLAVSSQLLQLATVVGDTP